MKNEENELKDAFRQMMDKEYSDIPAFEEMTTDLGKEVDIKEGKHRKLFPLLKYAAALIPIGLAAFYLLQKQDNPEIEYEMQKWEMTTDSFLIEEGDDMDISSWQSATDFLLDDNITYYEE